MDAKQEVKKDPLRIGFSLRLDSVHDTFLNEIQQPYIRPKDVALSYSLALRYSPNRVGWQQIDETIKIIWGVRVLRQIQRFAIHSGKRGSDSYNEVGLPAPLPSSSSSSASFNYPDFYSPSFGTLGGLSRFL